MYSFLILFAIILLVPIVVYVHAAIPADVLRSYPAVGIKTSTVNGTITQYLSMHGSTQINLILTATGGTFNSTNLVIAGSLDNSTFITLDTIALSTGTSKAITYSDSLKATTLPVNPASFPFLKITTSAGVISVTEKLYFVAQ